MKSENIFVSKNIKHLRNTKKITQNELAKKLGITDRAVSNYESGIREPDAVMLGKIANFFDVNIDDLLFKNMNININISNNILKKYEPLFSKYDKLSDDDKKFIAMYIEEKKRQIDEEYENIKNKE